MEAASTEKNGLSLPHTSAMAAAMWTVRVPRALTVLGTVTRSRSSQTALKPQYDALVIGGGEICETVAIMQKCAEITATALQYDKSMKNMQIVIIIISLVTFHCRTQWNGGSKLKRFCPRKLAISCSTFYGSTG